MVEYDLAESRAEEGVLFLADPTRLEHCPSAACWHPRLGQGDNGPSQMLSNHCTEALRLSPLTHQAKPAMLRTA